MKEKATQKLFGSITNVNEQFVEESQSRAKRKNLTWVRLGAVAACLCLVLGAVFAIPKLNPAIPENGEYADAGNDGNLLDGDPNGYSAGGQASNNGEESQKDYSAPSNQDSEGVVETSYLNIYYISENGAIESKSIEVNYAAKDIFNKWAELNNISDVAFVNCVYSNGGTETAQGEAAGYTPGNYYTLTITLSAEFSMHVESENGNLLIESLRQTFHGYLYFDEFNLTIE